MKWIVLGFIIISPIAGLLLNQWLRQYAYRTSLSWWIYALAGTAAFIIAILTIGLKTLRISRSNPAKLKIQAHNPKISNGGFNLVVVLHQNI